MSKGFERICSIIAARQCYDSGQSLTQIATSAKVSKLTVKRWIETSYGGIHPTITEVKGQSNALRPDSHHPPEVEPSN
jgi:transposase